MLELLNEEIKRRTRAVRIFSNTASYLKLVRALAVEQHEHSQEEHRYLNMGFLVSANLNLDADMRGVAAPSVQLSRADTPTTFADDAPLAGGDAWPGDAVASASPAESYRPDPRNLRHQRYCSEPACRAAKKAASQARWLARPENHDYFRGPVHLARNQA
jgi:hypothetical protein